ncbi:Uncharacterized protein PBTT_05956 [Plasmodiophora brassicae]
MASRTAGDCVGRLRALVGDAFAGVDDDGAAAFHPMTLPGSRLHETWRAARAELDALKACLTGPRGTAADRAGRLQTERARLRRQLHILTSEIDGSLASISERRDRDQARREGCEPLAELARKAEAACGRCGGLSCDIEMAPPVKKPSFPASTPTGSGDQTRSLTIIIGSEGELACFAIEVNASMVPYASNVTIDSVSVTFQFGDIEWSNDEVDRDVSDCLENGSVDDFCHKLKNVIQMEALSAKNPAANPHTVREQIREKFQRVPSSTTHEVLEGPSCQYAELPVDLCSHAPDRAPAPHSLTFVSASEIVDERDPSALSFHFELRPPVPMSWATASLIAGHRHVDSADVDRCSLKFLLAGDALTYAFAVMDGVSVSSAIDGNALLDRGIIATRLTLTDLGSLDALVVPALQRQVVFNSLFRSCCRSGGSRHRAPSVCLEVLECSAESFFVKARATSNKSSQNPTLSVSVGLGGSISLSMSPDVGAPSSVIEALLAKCLDLAVVFHFLLKQ